MHDDNFSNGPYFENLSRHTRSGLQSRSTYATEDKRPYVWPNYEMYLIDGGGAFSLYRGRRRSVDDIRTVNYPRKMINVKPYKDSGISDVSISSSQKTGSSTRSKRTFSQVISEYSEKCSVVGVPFIREARSTTERAIWVFLLLGAIAVTMLHLKMLFSSYFSYSKHTQINLGFDTLAFPAITICNVNTMRMSQKANATKEMLQLINSVSMDSLKQQVKQWQPQYSSPDSGSQSGNKDDHNSNSDSPKNRDSNFFDAMPVSINVSSPRADLKNFYKTKMAGSWQAESEESTFNYVRDTFKDLWVALDSDLRYQMGHQIQDMLLQCSFAGGQCLMSNFTRTESATYGNCYTASYSKWIARRSGPGQGLEMILYLETDEYVPGITNEKGIQLVVHEQETLAFPDDEGIAVAAGTQTVIGLKQVQIERLGDPYGGCSKPEDFLDKYGIKYTRTACQKICEQTLVLQQCNCYDELAQQINSIMNKTTGNLLVPCRNESEMQCLAIVQMEFDTNKCDCNSPCREIQFEKTISSRQWPSSQFADVMVDMICQESPGNSCDNLKKKDKVDSGLHSRSEEFIKLNIYFEDLNYELLSEAADYELTQFLSDVGGTVGLYIGLSVLGIFELFHLCIDIMNYCCCSGGQRVEQLRYG